MTEQTKIIIEQALALPADERERLFRALGHSLGKDETEVEAAWFDEAEDRFAAYKRGELGSATLDEIIAEKGR